MAWYRNLSLLHRSAAFLALALATATAHAADRPGEADAKKLVAMVRGTLAGAPTIGAAVVIGAANDRLYLVTANHIVRREGEIATDLKVELRTLPGERLTAEVLPHHDRELDLAVLIVREVNQRGVPVQAFPFDRLGNSGSLNRGAGVFSIGQAGAAPWWTNVDADVVADRSGTYVYFQSPLLRPGQSGGGLFDANWLLVALVLGEERSGIKALLIEEVISFLLRNSYPVELMAAPPRQNTQLNCPTKRESFDAFPPRLFDDGGGGHYGYDRLAFNMTLAWPGAWQKRCLDCRVKSSAARVSANVWDNGKAASWGLYILDMSEERGEMYSIELEQGNRVSVKHYRDGHDPVILWAGTYHHTQEKKTHLTIEAKEGILIASVNDAELGRAAYDSSLIPDVGLGAGFIVAAGTQVPASVWFDDYEFTACFP
ncbi:MAG TPA: hypothetical protein DD490_05175 [Acidobacteria bacterium]|nr:hypothetical protein [Acidobacteriota bacterium]